MLDEEGEPRLHSFSWIAAAVPQEGILRGLLADRRATADAASGSVPFHRIFNGFNVKSMMRAELAVLGCNGCADHVAVDLADRHPVLLSATPVNEVADHVDRDRRIDEPVGEHPQHGD